ncbi:MAG: hypothetical protein KGH65_02995 [Candidatus Micrarchaeota archaeon]|nr:hypothetical protein [Candidatus Micrarchaeota archaeon]
MQIVVQRGTDSSLLLLERKIYEVSHMGDKLLLTRMLSDAEQKRILEKTNFDYTKSVLCVMPEDGTANINTGFALSSIKSDLRLKLTNSEKNFLEVSLKAIFQNLKKQSQEEK